MKNPMNPKRVACVVAIALASAAAPVAAKNHVYAELHSDVCENYPYSRRELARLRTMSDFEDILLYTSEFCPEVASALSQVATASTRGVTSGWHENSERDDKMDNPNNRMKNQPNGPTDNEDDGDGDDGDDGDNDTGGGDGDEPKDRGDDDRGDGPKGPPSKGGKSNGGNNNSSNDGDDDDNDQAQE